MLTIIGFAVIVIATYNVYKTAKDNGRNAIGWSLTTIAVGLGLQFIIPVILGIILGVYLLLSGASELEMQQQVQGPGIIIGIVGLFLSFVGIWLIMRHVSKIPEEKPFAAPPSPPAF